MSTLDRSTLNSNADSRINDNTTGDISPADVRQQVKDLADSNLNITSDKGTLYSVPKKMTGQTIANGTTTLTHNAGYPARQVSFTDNDGWPIELPWRVKVGEETTKIEVSSLEEIENVNVYLNCWT